MTDLVPTATAPPTFLPRQDEYHRVTDLATRLSDTEFVPQALRGKPASVLAAMLVGREVGIGPMHALRAIHVIEGKPSMSAELLMALVLRAGHDLYVADSTRDRCEVRYRRQSWPDDRPDGVVVWTEQDAKDAGLDGKGNWKKYRRAMLRSRAVSEAARQGFPDVVEGMGYTAEELGADDDVAVESIAPDQDDHDDLDTRRELHARAKAAYSALRDADEAAAATAWTSATAGLGADLWTDADLAILTGRVEQLERAAADLAGDVVDAEIIPDDDGEDDDEPDGGTPAEPDPEPEPDAGDGQAEPAGEVELDDEFGEPIPPDDPDPAPAPVQEPLDLSTPAPDDPAWVEAGWTAYVELSVTDVSQLIRHGHVDLDGGDRLVVPAGPAGLSLVHRWEHYRPGFSRKTVLGALDAAGFAPTVDLHGRPVAPPPVTADALAAHDNATGDDDGAPDASPPDDGNGPHTATSDLEARRGLLRRWKYAHREVAAIDDGKARALLADRMQAGAGEDVAWSDADLAVLTRLVEQAEQVHRETVPF